MKVGLHGKELDFQPRLAKSGKRTMRVLGMGVWERMRP